MPPLDERQAAFAAALLDPLLPAPQGLTGPDGEDSPRRFSVYRNNVAVALTEALEANFPATRRLVGDEFFRAMARGHALSNPPVSPILFDYGAGFPDFIAQFRPAAELPYLADVARIERAWTEAYHAPEADPLEPACLANLPSDQAGRLRFVIHPSVRIVRSQFPALTIWQMNVDGAAPAPVDLGVGGEDALVARPQAEVEVRFMPPGGADFLRSLRDGRNLAEAAAAGLVASASFDLAANLSELLGAGVFADCRAAGREDRCVGNRTS